MRSGLGIECVGIDSGHLWDVGGASQVASAEVAACNAVGQALAQESRMEAADAKKELRAIETAEPRDMDVHIRRLEAAHAEQIRKMESTHSTQVAAMKKRSDELEVSAAQAAQQAMLSRQAESAREVSSEHQEKALARQALFAARRGAILRQSQSQQHVFETPPAKKRVIPDTCHTQVPSSDHPDALAAAWPMVASGTATPPTLEAAKRRSSSPPFRVDIEELATALKQAESEERQLYHALQFEEGICSSKTAMFKDEVSAMQLRAEEFAQASQEYKAESKVSEEKSTEFKAEANKMFEELEVTQFDNVECFDRIFAEAGELDQKAHELNLETVAAQTAFHSMGSEASHEFCAVANMVGEEVKYAEIATPKLEAESEAYRCGFNAFEEAIATLQGAKAQQAEDDLGQAC